MLGFKAVDIGLFEERSHLWPSREFQNVRRSATNLKEKLDDLGLVASDIYLQTAPDFDVLAANHPDAERRRKARQWFDQTLDYAKICNAHHVSALPGAVFDNVGLEASFERCCEEMAWRVERATEAGVPFGIEGHVGSIVPTPDRLEQLLERVPGLNLTLDYTHFAYEGIPDDHVEPLLARTNHLHCRGGRHKRLQCSFKENQIDYDRIVARLRELEYSGFICVEYVWIDWEHCNETDNLSETILFRDALTKATG